MLKNLLSNAFKFTAQGGVRLNVSAVTGGWTPEHPLLSQAARVVAFEVSDTGIGIPPEKQRIIFEAFQQADASTSRKYGGTGLGLAISRELASLLGGEIQLRSNPGRRQHLHALPAAALRRADRRSRCATPATPTAPAPPSGCRSAARSATIEAVPDDREHVQPGEPTLLIVEDDPHYARVLVDLAHDHGFKVLVATRGADALALARQYRPTAVSLDVFLPDMLGWTVLSQLKQDPETRHIPVQIVTLDEDRQHGLARGAFSFLTKPAHDRGARATRFAGSRPTRRPRRKRLLVVEDNPAEQLTIRELLGHDDIDIVTADTGAAALAAMAEQPVDCVVLDLRLPDMTRLRGARDASARTRTLRDVPVVVFTGRELSPEEDARLRTLARSVVVKGVESPERLLDETALFLHRVTSRPAAREAEHARAPAPLRRGPRRQGGAGRRRRRPQHLRAVERARAARHEGADGEHRQRGHRAAGATPTTCRSC